MRQLPIEQQVLLILEIVALLALCVRMRLAALHGVYPYFFGYLLLECCQALIPMLVPLESHSYLYRDLYVATQVLILVFYALVVLELYSKVFQALPGIASLARRYIRIALSVSVLIALLPTHLETNAVTMTGYMFALERTVMSVLVIFMLLLSGFLVYYPVPLGRNVIVYMAGYAVFFMTVGTAELINNLGYFFNRTLSSVEMGVFLACLLFWLLALSRKGENRRVVVGHQWDSGADQKVMRQVEAMNAALLRSRPK